MLSVYNTWILLVIILGRLQVKGNPDHICNHDIYRGNSDLTSTVPTVTSVTSFITNIEFKATGQLMRFSPN